ncbi:tsf: translation elongation factor Ts [Rubrobacter radiotolerans]|uniref:Elongation factor Ts n=1 Tax=Rubrobacter radiotolerans TaxID=42256 RepID=A0A023X2X8_RUBRA|nr:translation elongation factor Ts [Rubrobacter radiotolerans]AHY46688.1 tsf: translation elongation factor Ts [Rubrobacter radiotolerans]MDX5894095.1 translation elongation factor Ts [Rubrobacter radiotolerans]SMC05184.1 elongation factor Ts [Rubrobacter radiotolerans DSM 5868]
MASQIEKIKQLREETAAAMMDVKRALEESNGDLEGARRVLRERGQAIAAKKSSREATEGVIEVYKHFNGRVGVLVEVNCETDFVARTDDFQQFAKNVALHVASMKPLCVSVEDIPAEALAEEREIAEKQAAEMGKPENITRQIVEGRIKKWTSEQALLTQPFAKDPEKTVEQLLQETIQKVGENVVIRRFVRFEL